MYVYISVCICMCIHKRTMRMLFDSKMYFICAVDILLLLELVKFFDNIWRHRSVVQKINFFFLRWQSGSLFFKFVCPFLFYFLHVHIELSRLCNMVAYTLPEGYLSIACVLYKKFTCYFFYITDVFLCAYYAAVCLHID